MTGFTSDLDHIARELPAAIALLELDGEVVWVNQATVDLVDLQPSGCIGQSIFTLLHDDDRPSVLNAFASLSSGEPGPVCDVRVRGDDGRWRPLVLRGRQVPGGTSSNDSVVVTLHARRLPASAWSRIAD